MKNGCVGLMMCLLMSGSVLVTTAEEAQDRSTVLVIVDIQDFYFAGGAVPLVGSVEASLIAKRVLERFRTLGLPVIHVQHLPKGRTNPGQNIEPASYRIHPNVAPRKGEVVIGKHFANSFRDTDLLEQLQRLGAKQLVIVGMQTHMCLEAATRAAADLGFEVTVVHDACATRDLVFGEEKVSAAEVHASTLASLDGGYAKVVSADALLSDLR